MQDTLNIDTLNAHCGSGPVSGPRLSEGRRKHQSRVENRSPGFSPLPSLSGDGGKEEPAARALGRPEVPTAATCCLAGTPRPEVKTSVATPLAREERPFGPLFRSQGCSKNPPFSCWKGRRGSIEQQRALSFSPFCRESGSGLWNFSSKKGHGEVSCGFGLGLRLWKGSR